MTRLLATGVLLWASTTCIAGAVTVNFGETFAGVEAPSLTIGPLTVTGSNTLSVAKNGGGFGVVGGLSKETVDSGEWVLHQFLEPQRNVSYDLWYTRDTNSDGVDGERILEVFDASGASLGQTKQQHFEGFVSDEFISAFSITTFPDRDAVALREVSFGLEPIPLPGGLVLGLSGVFLLGALGFRKKVRWPADPIRVVHL